MDSSAQVAPAKRPSTALAIIHKAEILDLVRQGYILREIAPQYGISPQAIHKAIGRDPEYRDAMLDQAAAMIEEAKTATWAATEQVDIARAREVTRFAFRYAESVDPARWGQRTEVRHGLTSDLSDELRAMSSSRRGRVIEQAPDKQSVALPHASLVDTGS